MRSPMPLIFVFVATLSGCTETGTDPTGPTVITDPDDFSYLNQSATDREHVHDYWGGKDMLLIDETKECGSSLLMDPVICKFRPDDPIPLGTGRIDVTLSWTEHDDTPSYYADTELHVKTSADNESRPVSLIDNGQTVTLDVTNDQNDLPHQRVSAWEFNLYVFGEDRDGIYPVETQKRFYADVRFEIVAYRTLEIPLFPGHPDLWQNRTEFPLVTDYRYPHDRVETHTPAGCTRCDDRRIRPDDRVIVPLEASYIELVLESHADDVSDQLLLYYHNATTYDWEPVEPVEVDGGRQVFEIPVAGGGDSPYALQSVWEFYVDYGTGPYLFGDYYRGYWTASATVHKTSVP